MATKKPVVAIVGKPNVGKSTLFNRLIKERKSIVSNQPHVTRDRIYGIANWLGREFNLIDTGGLTLKDNDFLKEIKFQVNIAITEADLIIFVTSNREGLDQNDEFITKLLLKSLKPVILVINKTDNKEQSYDLDQFYTLGFSTLIPISSIHGINIGELLDTIVKKTNFKQFELKSDATKISIVGKPNVGKSTLLNTILGQKRVITSSKAGTTRDSIDVMVHFNKDKYLFIDTAGIRKKNKVYEQIEKYAILRTQLAMERSDITLLLIDVNDDISEQDKKISGLALNSLNPIIFVINKMDTIKDKEKTQQKITTTIKNNFKFIKNHLILFISAKDKKDINKIFNAIIKIKIALKSEIKKSHLNKIIVDLQIIKSPPMVNNKKLKIYYGEFEYKKQPNFVFYVNNKSLCHFSYLRFIENQIREYYPFPSIPLKITLKNKKI